MPLYTASRVCALAGALALSGVSLAARAQAPAAGHGAHGNHSQAATTAPSAAPVKLGDLVIAKAFTRQPPTGARVAGGYVTITNTGKTADRLIGGSAAFAKRFEVHEMTMDGGMMKMRELAQGIEIKPGETVELKPGGLHVMFMDLTQAPIAGKPVKATLRFERAGEVEVDFAVVAASAGKSSAGKPSADKKGHGH